MVNAKHSGRSSYFWDVSIDRTTRMHCIYPNFKKYFYFRIKIDKIKKLSNQKCKSLRFINLFSRAIVLTVVDMKIYIPYFQR